MLDLKSENPCTLHTFIPWFILNFYDLDNPYTQLCCVLYEYHMIHTPSLHYRHLCCFLWQLHDLDTLPTRAYRQLCCVFMTITWSGHPPYPTYTYAMIFMTITWTGHPSYPTDTYAVFLMTITWSGHPPYPTDTYVMFYDNYMIWTPSLPTDTPHTRDALFRYICHDFIIISFLWSEHPLTL